MRVEAAKLIETEEEALIENRSDRQEGLHTTLTDKDRGPRVLVTVELLSVGPRRWAVLDTGRTTCAQGSFNPPYGRRQRSAAPSNANVQF